MFNKEYKPIEEEQEIFSIVEAMAIHPETEVSINTDNQDCLLENKELHFTVIIRSTYISLTNTNFCSRRQFESKAINKLKSYAYVRNSENFNLAVKRVESREQEMFKKMNDQLKQ